VSRAGVEEGGGAVLVRAGCGEPDAPTRGTETSGFAGTGGTGGTSGAIGGSESLSASRGSGSEEPQPTISAAPAAQHKRCNGDLIVLSAVGSQLSDIPNPPTMLNTSNQRGFVPRVSGGFALFVLVTACAPIPAPAPAPVPEPSAPLPAVRPPAPVAAGLPAIPLVTGPLAIDVVYPPAGDIVPPGDSAMIFGSVGNGNAFVTINGIPVPVWPNGAFMAFIPVPPRTNPVYHIAATTGTETARLVHPVAYPQPDTAQAIVSGPDTISGRWAVIRPAPDAHPDRVIWGRTLPGGDPTTFFFFLPGTMVRVTGQSGANLLVALDAAQEIRISANDLALEPPGFTPPPRTAGAPRVAPAADWVDVSIPVSSPPPYLFTSDGNVLRLTLFGTAAATGDTIATSGTTMPGDPLLTSIQRTHSDLRSTYVFTLSRNVFGYTPAWRDGELVVRIRRQPVVDPTAPLRGLTIAVDPGHAQLPGESPGATGPTRLREPEAVLAVGLRVQEHLAQRGAYVVMTRATSDPVALNARAAIAERADAHAFVSIHLDAVPGNVNPFQEQGTLTIYWHDHARQLAHHTQQAMLRNMLLRDRGLRRDYFAMIRSPWMPSVLTEGAFLIMPDQEYAMRTPEYQDAYARSIVEGLESYFAEVAAGR